MIFVHIPDNDIYDEVNTSIKNSNISFNIPLLLTIFTVFNKGYKESVLFFFYSTSVINCLEIIWFNLGEFKGIEYTF